MPIYEYQCSVCGRTFEFLKLNDGEVPSCCGQTAVRILSAASYFQFPKDFSFAKDCCKRDRDACCEREHKLSKNGGF